MRGHYHDHLRELLKTATAKPGCDQTSLAEHLKRDQSGISKYLRNLPVAGTMDLDEADRALAHCGLGGLREFVLGTPAPDREAGVPPRILELVKENEQVRELLTDLVVVPPDKRGEALEIVLPIVRALHPTRRGGRPPGTGGGTRTKGG